MKINWGYRIALLYLSFVILIGFFVIRSLGEKFDLVSGDYYADELKYQERIDDIRRTAHLDPAVKIRATSDGIILEFPKLQPEATIRGTVLLFRPSNQSLDRTYPLTLQSENQFCIPAATLERGNYRIKVDFEYQGEKYYIEKEVFVE